MSLSMALCRYVTYRTISLVEIVLSQLVDHIAPSQQLVDN